MTSAYGQSGPPDPEGPPPGQPVYGELVPTNYVQPTYYPSAGYPPAAGTVVPHPGAPFGYDPVSGRPYSDKSRLTAGLLGIFLGWCGVGRFYTGHTGLAIGQIGAVWGSWLVACCLYVGGSALTLGAGAFIFWVVLLLPPLAGFWPFIDGIIVLARGGTDSNGRVLRG